MMLPKKLLKAFGHKVVYRDHRGDYSRRYDPIDLVMSRPIRENMSVAYPSAKAKMVKERPKATDP